ncbi:DUF397 domain-containing protein [Actinoplanes sp. NPDC051861]|uniref:DUF397 domain-containing protein n=1 Tax=Actinoplanes sp. NPDC051861 TaxID=3155170 RepID=UPI00343935B7
MTDSSWSDAVWRKSSRSVGGGECVEVAVKGGEVAVRDSKSPDGPMLIFSLVAWRSFIEWIAEEGEGSRP